MSYKFLLLGFALLLSMIACRKKELSSLVNQDRIFLDYTLTYNEYLNRTYAAAQFYMDNIKGRRVELSQNSRIFYAGQELVRPNKNSTNYNVSIIGIIDSSDFVWNDTEQSFYYHQAALPPYIGANTQYLGWQGSNWGYNFYWQGDTLAAGESVILELRVEDPNGDNFTIEASQRTRGRDYVHIPSWDLERMQGGSLCYHQKGADSHPTRGYRCRWPAHYGL